MRDTSAGVRQNVREAARRRVSEYGQRFLRERGLLTSAPPPPPRPARGRITEKDVQLLAIVDAMGGMPEMTTAATWEEILRRWNEAGHHSTKADSLRRRWGRLKPKPRSRGQEGGLGTARRPDVTT